jgi:hypothetical protein
MEKYIDIKGYEGYYQVSNYGLIKSLARVVNAHEGKRKLNIKERVLKPAIDNNGYFRVALCKGRRLTTFKVHRLVAGHFILNENPKLEVNHKDGNKLNNSVNNLEWVTHSENVIHAFKNNLAQGLKGSKNPQSKLTEKDVFEIRTIAKAKRNYGRLDLAKKYGVSEKHIQDIVNNKNIWTDVKI